MADEGVRTYLVGFLLAGLFIVAMVGFMNNLYGFNSDNQTIVQTGYIEYDSLEANISTAGDDSEDWLETFTSESSVISFGEIVFNSITGIGTLVIGTIKTLLGIYGQIGSNLLGLDPMVLGVINAIILSSLIFLIWRLYRAGY